MGSSDLSPPGGVHALVTRQIVEAIERGAGTFTMPWHGAGHARTRPANAATRKPYQGVNVLSLWAEGVARGYGSGAWASYRQWQELGAQVRRGEHGSVVVFYRKLDSDADEEERPRLIARASRVFNAAQVDGWGAEPPPAREEISDKPTADLIVIGSRAVIEHGGTRAYYDRRQDLIVLPDRSRFRATATSSVTESFYAVLLHELTHWTGADNRLNRQFGSRFGDEAYAFEELVAELGAAFLCADLGVCNAPRADHAAYVTSWLRVLKDDTRMIFTASRLASEAAKFLMDVGRSAGPALPAA
jgi:antirestriction protein ArdC